MGIVSFLVYFFVIVFEGEVLEFVSVFNVDKCVYGIFV